MTRAGASEARWACRSQLKRKVVYGKATAAAGARTVEEPRGGGREECRESHDVCGSIR